MTFEIQRDYFGAYPPDALRATKLNLTGGFKKKGVNKIGICAPSKYYVRLED